MAEQVAQSNDGAQTKVQTGAPASEQPTPAPHRVTVAEDTRISLGSDGVVRSNAPLRATGGPAPDAAVLDSGRTNIGAPVPRHQLTPQTIVMWNGKQEPLSTLIHLGLVTNDGTGYKMVGGAQGEQQTDQQDKQQGEYERFKPSGETDKALGEVVQQIGDAPVLGIIDTLARGGDLTQQINAIASRVGKEPREVAARIDSFVADYVKVGERASGMDPEQYQHFVADVSARHPEAFQDAIYKLAIAEDARGLRKLAKDWTTSAAGYSEGDLLAMGRNTEGADVFVQDGKAMIRLPAPHGVMPIRQAIRQGIVSL